MSLLGHIRAAIRRRVRPRRFRALQRSGRLQAERLGIGPEDVEDLIDELRDEHA